MAKMEVLKNLAGRSGTHDSRSVSLTIKDIPLGDIKICDNVRKSYSGIEELSKSIRQYGLLQPITVYPEGDCFVVKTGHRRFMAFQKLYTDEPERFHSIRCILSTGENLATIQLVENVQREELSQIDLYNALSNLRENGMTLKQIAEVMGKTEKVIKNLFVGINEIDGDNSLKEFIDSPAGGTINDVAETKCVKNKDDRLKLLEKRKRGEISRAKLRKEIKALKYEEPAIQDKLEAKSDEPISPEPFVKYDVSPNGLVITLEFCDRKHAEVIDAEIRQLLMSHQVKVLGV